MHLILGLAFAQEAGTDVCVVAEARARAPGCVELASLVQAPDPKDEAIQSLATLRSELDAVRPLVDAFDGELEIMSRLSTASEQVTWLRDDLDRELLYEALLLTGFAVNRYFQDQLAVDPAAAPYRQELAGRTVPLAWVEAAALDPDRDPLDSVLSDPGAVAAFDAVRAQVRLAPRALVAVQALPEGASLWVDGRMLGGSRGQVAPGTHRVAVLAGEELLYHQTVLLAPSQELVASLGLQRMDVEALRASLEGAEGSVALEPPVVEALAGLSGPLRLVTAEETWLVYGATASPAEEPKTTSEHGPRLGVSIGGGWMYDGDWLLQNHAEGAPSEASTVNAVVPVLGVDLRYVRGPLALGVGSDLVLPTGAWQTLPVGDTALRLRAHPYVAVGHPLARVTVGYLFPWQLGLGARASIPLGPVELGGAFVYGLGLDQAREQGPEFEPADVRTAWISLGYSFGG